MNTDKRRWMVMLLCTAWFFVVGGPPTYDMCDVGHPKANAFVDIDYVRRQEQSRVNQFYDRNRVIRWGFSISEDLFGYSYPYVDVSEIGGIGFTR